MTLSLAIAAAALVLGVLMPLRWGVLGFLGTVVLLFVAQTSVHLALGFEGTSIEESLLLFNNSWAAYIGFNLQITYRSFTVPVLLLATAVIFRMAKAART